MKKIMISLAVLAVLAAAIIVVKVNSRVDQLFESNVEALAASGEGGSGFARCYSSIPYGTYARYLQCKTCIYVDGMDASGWGICR